MIIEGAILLVVMGLIVTAYHFGYHAGRAEERRARWTSIERRYEGKI